MHLRYAFTELGQALRRNVSMHVAVVLTLFVSLTLAGLGILFQKEADKTVEYFGDQLQLTVWLCKTADDNPGCTSEVTDTQQAAIEAAIEDNPEVAEYRFESQQVAFEKTKELLGPEQFEGPNSPITAEDLRASYWITLNEPDQGDGINSAVEGLDGVSYTDDLREELEPIYKSLDVIKWGAIGVAGFLVIAALLLVANTIRLAALARRKEIAIMRMVGASSLYIGLPFLLEALVTAALGVALAAGSLAAFMQFGIIDRVEQQLRFMPWIGWEDFWYALGVIGVLGAVLTLLPTLVLTRKYIKV